MKPRSFLRFGCKSSNRFFLLQSPVLVLPRTDRQLCYDEKHLEHSSGMRTIDLQCFFSGPYLLWAMIYLIRGVELPSVIRFDASVSLGDQWWSRRIGTKVASTTPAPLQAPNLVLRRAKCRVQIWIQIFLSAFPVILTLSIYLFSEKEDLFQEQYTKFAINMGWLGSSYESWKGLVLHKDPWRRQIWRSCRAVSNKNTTTHNNR